jgi:hypothetical protein
MASGGKYTQAYNIAILTNNAVKSFIEEDIRWTFCYNLSCLQQEVFTIKLFTIVILQVYSNFWHFTPVQNIIYAAL